MKKEKILVIVGPTAVGKTAEALRLAKKFDGEIISADSRQLYKGLSAVSGKEIETWVAIHGYDLVFPNQSFSVSQYETFARKCIKEVLKRKKLPILVGGTGLYIKAVIDGIKTSSVPPNIKLRDSLSSKSWQELLSFLTEINPEKALNLNESDRKNPRRLIRAIEVTQGGKTQEDNYVDSSIYDYLMIGLTAPLSELENRVSNNIEARLEKAILEVRQMLLSVPLDAQVFDSLGVDHIVNFINGNIDKDELVSLWRISERNYVKRQLTWFKKEKRIQWIDVTEADFREKIDKIVNSWNNRS